MLCEGPGVSEETREQKRSRRRRSVVRMTSVADFISIWETVVGAEMFPKCLPEQGRANLATALVQFSNNHKLSYKTQHKEDVKIAPSTLLPLVISKSIF